MTTSTFLPVKLKLKSSFMTAVLPVTFTTIFPFVVTPTLFVAQFVRFSSADVAEIEKAEVVKLRYIFTFLRNLFVSGSGSGYENDNQMVITQST